MGSTPTGASLVRSLVVAAAFVAATVVGAGSPAFGQIEMPSIPRLNPYVPGPGAAAPGNLDSSGNMPTPPGAVPSGEIVRQYSDDEMQQYFDGRVADEFYDDCTWEDRVCYGYVAVDSLFWDRVRSTSSTVAIRSSTGAVLFNGRNFIWNDLEAVPRLTAGYVFDNGYALEGTYFYKDDLDTSAGIQIPGDISVNAFGAPSAAFAENFFQADTLGAWTAVSMQGAEAHIVQTNEFFNFLFGFRWIELQDRLALTVTKGAIVSGADFSTYNTLLGGQMGFKVHQQYGQFGFDGFGKLGMYLNSANSQTTIYSAGAGLPDQTRNSGGNSEAFVAEGQVMATYNPYIWMTMRLGWQVLLIQQVALANDQIHDNDLTGFTLSERSDIIYHGPFGGLEFRW